MANQAKGQARDFAFSASGKLCSTLQKQFYICVIFIWNKSLFFIAKIEQLPMPSKLCWFQNRPSSLLFSLVHAGHALLSTLLPSWDKFLVISNFNCWWETFVYTKNVECWLPERFWVLIDHVLVEWAFTSYDQLVLSCKQFGDFFLDRWEVFVLHASTKNPTAVEHFWILLSADWSCLIWMRWCRLEPGHLL